MAQKSFVITRTACQEAGTLPEFELRVLTRETVRAARRYFAQPDTQARFAAWLAEKQAAGMYIEKEVEA